MKRVVVILLAVALLVILVGINVRRYLKSRQVVENVVTQLKAAYGGDVKLSEVDIGLKSASMSGIEFFEVNCADAKSPWLTVQSLTTDVSILDLLQGKAVPTDIKIGGVKLILRFTKEGKLLTCLPGAFFNEPEEGSATPSLSRVPKILLENSEVIFRVEGSDDFVLQNVEGKLDKNKDRYTFAGSVQNPKWGRWTVSSSFDEKSESIAAEAKSDAPLVLTKEMRHQLPFVPTEMWQESHQSTNPLESRSTHSSIQVRYDLKRRKFAK